MWGWGYQDSNLGPLRYQLSALTVRAIAPHVDRRKDYPTGRVSPNLRAVREADEQTAGDLDAEIVKQRHHRTHRRGHNKIEQRHHDCEPHHIGEGNNRAEGAACPPTLRHKIADLCESAGGIEHSPDKKHRDDTRDREARRDKK